MKKILTILGVVLTASALYAGGANEDINTIVVGATPVPHAELLALVQEDLQTEGYDLQIVEFTDYVTPNLALADGEIDVNFFQHIPYLESFSRDKGLKLEVLAPVHIEPLGVYSKELTAISDIKEGSVIAVPNDPTNEGRALLLLQAAGLIVLSEASGLEATPSDIIENPLNLSFAELDAAQLPRALSDVDAAVINGNYALEAGLNPVNDSIYLEGADSPYANILVVRAGELQDSRFKALVKVLQSQKVKDYILENYNGGVVATF